MGAAVIGNRMSGSALVQGLSPNQGGLADSGRGNGYSVDLHRQIVSPLVAWDAVAHQTTTLEPGTQVSGCRIRRNHQSQIECGADPYVMCFEIGGSSYECALPRFQARTRFVAAVTSESLAF